MKQDTIGAVIIIGIIVLIMGHYWIVSDRMMHSEVIQQR